MGFEQIKVELLDVWPKGGHEGDKDVAHAAWASSIDKDKAEAKGIDDILRIVNQIVDHQHDTPKETVWFKFFVSFPIFCERQYDKYRMTVQLQDLQLEWYEAPFGRWGITQNELSGRYRTLPDRPYTLPKDVLEILADVAPGTEALYNTAIKAQRDAYNTILDLFKPEWKKNGNENNWKYKRVREVVRGLLGTAFFTDMRIICNLNAFEHIINQRLAKEAQVESRVTAFLMLDSVMRSGAIDIAIKRMMEKNGWQVWYDEIKLLLKP